jgi:hypothetical protein
MTTRLGLLNFCLLQFFFIRLTRCERKVITKFDLESIDLMPGGVFVPSGRVREFEIESWYAIQYWIVPFTGWSSDFVYLGRKGFIHFNKKNS